MRADTLASAHVGAASPSAEPDGLGWAVGADEVESRRRNASGVVLGEVTRLEARPNLGPISPLAATLRDQVLWSV